MTSRTIPTTPGTDISSISLLTPLASTDDLATADLKRLHALWDQLRGPAPHPPRAALSPAQLKFMLARISLIEVLPDGGFRWRVAGTWWRDTLGFEATGLRVDEWPFPEQRELVKRSYRQVAEGRRPLHAEREILVDGRLLRYEILLLPLGNGDEVDMILSGTGEISRL
jgi:hypothetical protein